MLFRGEDFFFRRKEFYFVGTNFCLLERMLFRDTECYFVRRVFFVRRNEFKFVSTQADVLKMSCCPLNFGFTPPHQTKKPQNDTNLRVTDCPTTKNITGYCCLPNSFIVDNSLRIHPPFPRSLFLFCFFQSYASHFHLN